MCHTIAWLGWVCGVLVALTVTRNPLYIALVLLCVAIVNASSRPAAGSPPVPLSPTRFAVTVVGMTAAFNAATVHFGDTVLFRLPRALPLVGGVITLEALVFGALNGAVLSGLFAAFTVLNLSVSTRALVDLIPRAFYPVAVVISIALTFVPTTLRQVQQIREAQAVRGHRVKGFRDWLPLFVPLLIGGMERAVQLAEAMTARGFGSIEDRAGDDIMTKLSVVLGMAALLGGWLLRLGWGRETWGLGLMLAGAGLVVIALWLAGRRAPRTIYHSEPWTLRDGLVLLGATAVMVAFLVPIPGLDRGSLSYYPYPRLSLPRFEPWIGIAVLGLLSPTLSSAVAAHGERS
jgi:energy-coupling factor transport system permease protein